MFVKDAARKVFPLWERSPRIRVTCTPHISRAINRIQLEEREEENERSAQRVNKTEFRCISMQIRCRRRGADSARVDARLFAQHDPEDVRGRGRPSRMPVPGAAAVHSQQEPGKFNFLTSAFRRLEVGDE